MKHYLKTTRTLTAALIAYASLAATANATILYTSGVSSSVSAPIGSRGSATAPDMVQTVATTFTLTSQSQLTSFTAEAIYADGNTTTPNPTAPNDDAFTFALYSDGGGATPGSMIGSPIDILSFNRTDTGVDYSGYDIYSFNLNLPSPINLAADTYWLSIIDSTPSDPDYRWSWLFSSTGEISDPRYASNGTDQFSTYTFTTNRSLIFTVEGNAIPEPSAAALAMGIGALGFVARRRRKH